MKIKYQLGWIEDWISDQIASIEASNFTPREQDIIAENIYKFDHDPVKFATIQIGQISRIGGGFIEIDEIISNHKDIISLNLESMHFITDEQEDHFISAWDKSDKGALIIGSTDTSSDYEALYFTNIIGNMEVSRSPYFSYRIADIEDNRCLLSCLRRKCESKGFKLEIEQREDSIIGIAWDEFTHRYSEIISKQALHIFFS